LIETSVKNSAGVDSQKEQKEMSSDSNPKDYSNPRDATLAFVIESLKEHEQNLDKLIRHLAELEPQIEQTKELHSRFEEIEIKVEDLEKEIKRLTSYLATDKKE
jgi:DNA repair exonuclease SbcCD ATPase subunit